MERLGFKAGQSGSGVCALDPCAMLPLIYHVLSIDTGHLHLWGYQADLAQGGDKTTSLSLSTFLFMFSLHCTQSFTSLAVLSSLIQILQSQTQYPLPLPWSLPWLNTAHNELSSLWFSIVPWPSFWGDLGKVNSKSHRSSVVEMPLELSALLTTEYWMSHCLIQVVLISIRFYLLN